MLDGTRLEASKVNNDDHPAPSKRLVATDVLKLADKSVGAIKVAMQLIRDM